MRDLRSSLCSAPPVYADSIRFQVTGRTDGHLENLSETAEDFEPVIDQVPDLGLTLDVGHANLGGSENKSIAIIEKFGRLIRHVHLHDNRGGQSKDDDLHLPIGTGTVDFPGIMAALLRAGYDGTMTLEVKPEFQGVGRNSMAAMVKKVQEF